MGEHGVGGGKEGNEVMGRVLPAGVIGGGKERRGGGGGLEGREWVGWRGRKG